MSNELLLPVPDELIEALSARVADRILERMNDEFAPSSGRWMRTHEAAEYLGWTRSALYKQLARRSIPTTRLIAPFYSSGKSSTLGCGSTEWNLSRLRRWSHESRWGTGLRLRPLGTRIDARLVSARSHLPLERHPRKRIAGRISSSSRERSWTRWILESSDANGRRGIVVLTKPVSSTGLMNFRRSTVRVRSNR